MTLIAHIAAQISFLDIGCALIAVGVIERALLRLPPDVVGPGGWLLDTGPAD